MIFLEYISTNTIIIDLDPQSGPGPEQYNNMLSCPLRKGCGEMHRGQKGFTLIELLIVIIVLAVLTGIAIPTYRVVTSRARESAVENEMTNIAKALEMHQTDLQAYPLTDDYPDSIEDNDYMENIPEEDAWGNDYIYSSDGSSYSLESYGINCIDGGDDDIVITNGVLISDGAYENR